MADRGVKRAKRGSVDENAETPKEKKQKSEAVPQISTEQNTTNDTKAHEPEEGTDRPVRVYADGIYDLFHFGHARSLEQAKKVFPNTYLLVGVCNDELTHRLKGKTVMTDHERAESLRHCKWVDEVVENAPWIVTKEFMDEHKIDYVAHGDDIILDHNGDDIYKFVKDAGKYKTIKRTEGISTSDLILRIVKDYDSYVRRNLARGYTGKQMNIGFVKQKQIQMEDNIKKIKEKINDRVNKVQNWSKSHVRLLEFIQRFGGRVERLVGLDESYDSSDDLSGFTSPDRAFASPEQQEYTEEEQPPHV